MKTRISETPAQEAGEYITEKLREHTGEHILLLLGGGSALLVLDHIDINALHKQVTLVTTDERFTRDIQGNNFSALEQLPFYTKATEQEVSFINSVPREGESHHAFAKRLQDAFDHYFIEFPNAYTIGLFGIGEDGHTASIFPANESDFEAIYQDGKMYVPVTQSAFPYPLRTTVTPTFIEEKIDDVVLFAVGSNKCDNILNYMYNRNFSNFQIPALFPAQHPQSILFTDCPTLI